MIIEFSEEDTLSVHALLLAHHSRYFHTVLNRESERDGNVVTITEEIQSIDDMRLFIDWLYIRSAGEREECNDCITSRYGHKDFIRGWILGDDLGAPSFQDDMVRYILHDKRTFDWVYGMSDLWDDILCDSALESLIIDLLCRDLLKLDEKAMLKALDEVPDTITRKVLRLLLPNLQKVNTGESDMLVNGGVRYSWNIGSFEKYRVDENMKVEGKKR